MSDSNEHWIDRERHVLAACTQRHHDPTFGPVFVRGTGSWLWDAAGRDYLDFTCGYSTTNFGHAFEPLLEVAKSQLGRLSHLTALPHPGRALLAELLLEVCGFSRSGKVLFNTSGARAIESAWKACVNFRPGRLVTIGNAYHGRSIATSIISDTQGALQTPLRAGLAERRSPRDFGYCAACPWRLKYPECDLRCTDQLIADIRAQGKEISALLVEPALGARGYIFPPDEYWKRLRQVTGELGILMIADEIQMGLGRAGEWLLSAAQGWRADLVILGKSLGGGMVPISAVVGRAEVLDCIPAGSESETFAGTPLATALALEVVQQLKTGPWMMRCHAVGRILSANLQLLLERHRIRGTIEGRGACAAIELLDPENASRSEAEFCARLAKTCMELGLLVHCSGPLGTRIVLIPPFTVSDDELREGLDRFDRALHAITIGATA